MKYTNENNQLKVTKTLYKEDGSTYEVDYTYTRDFLDEQITNITAQRDEMIALKEAELAEVQLLLDKCNELNIQ